MAAGKRTVEVNRLHGDGDLLVECLVAALKHDSIDVGQIARILRIWPRLD